jgi:hypothetical protein
MADESEPTDITNRSGGTDLNAQGDVNVGGDATGRDKVTNAGGHIIHAEAGATVIVGEPPPAFKRFDHDEEPTERKPPTPEDDTANSHKPINLGAQGRRLDRRSLIRLLAGVAFVGAFVLVLIIRLAPLILTNSSWIYYVEDTARSSLTLKAVPESNYAIDVNFDLKQGGWAGIYKKLKLPAFGRIRFLYKGTGACNTIELKLIDINDTVFEVTRAHATDTNGQSQSWEPQYSEFQCRKGSGLCQDENAVRSLTLKPEDLDRVDISISNKSEHGDEAGPGRIIIEQIQIVP